MSIPRALIFSAIALALVTSWCSVARAAAQPCTLKTAEFCRDTNQLVWSPGFDGEIKRFVGPHTGEFATLQRQVFASLGGPPDRPVEMLGYKAGGWLFSACKAHECPVKGALLLDYDHSIRGLAVFDFGTKGEGNPRLDLILRDPEDTKARDVLTAWANWTIAQDLFTYSGDYVATKLTGIRVLPAQRLKN